MTKAHYVLLLLIVAHFNSFSQKSVNDYKYIIVPKQYEFLKEQDQYQINSLTKFLFNKYGYEAYMQDEELPNDLQLNRCLGLTSDVVKESAFLKTKLRIDLKDCNGNVVLSSKVGETREKEYAKAYNLALREAFQTFQHMGYSYQPNKNILAKASVPLSDASDKKQEEITRLKEEIKSLKEDQVQTVEINESPENPSKGQNPIEEPMLEEKEGATVETIAITNDVLYAQPISNGYQIVDTTPKKVMILVNTGVKDVFKVEGKKAIVYKKGDIWMYSESGDIFEGKIINIKF